MSRYSSRCFLFSFGYEFPLNCQDYGRIHTGGPDGCRSPSTESYGVRVYDYCGLGPDPYAEDWGPV